MCGIFGAVLPPAARARKPLLDGLARLEYRGYDSAGIALRQADGSIARARVSGRVNKLRLRARGLEGAIGIAHTRWATHGAPTEQNAHPLVARGQVAVVHNGIIENHAALRAELRAAGCAFESETDSETAAHLIEREIAGGRDFFAAVRAAAGRLQGAFALAAMRAGANGDEIALARRGSPLLIGVAGDAVFAASDAVALAPAAGEIIALENGDCALLSRRDGAARIEIVDAEGAPVARERLQIENNPAAAMLGGHRHYMQKEIFEQPDAVAATARPFLDGDRDGLRLADFGPGAGRLFARARGVSILACGTSLHAAMIARRWIEEFAQIPCRAENAGEYRYAQTPEKSNLVVAVSQSGETADTLGALDAARARAPLGLAAISNAPLSTLARATRIRILTRAGPEIGVAATKSFSAQLTALFLLALALGKARGALAASDEARALESLRRLPFAAQKALALEPAVADWAADIARRKSALFIGRRLHYPVALEGALKLKEISYIHAEGCAAAELKHGPLALVDAETPVVALAPDDDLRRKTESSLAEVAARGAPLFVLGGRGFDFGGARAIEIEDDGGRHLSPIVFSIPLQLLAYHCARVLGTDIDKPRNLAKSVTVE